MKIDVDPVSLLLTLGELRARRANDSSDRYDMCSVALDLGCSLEDAIAVARAASKRDRGFKIDKYGYFKPKSL